MINIIFISVLQFILLVSISTSIFAGVLINPIKLDLKGKTTTASIKITNFESGDTISLQANGTRWIQDENGEDVYEPTGDLVFYPKIVSIDNGAEKTVRIGFQGQPDASVEKAYRLFLEEIPVRKPGEMLVQMVLRFGVPVFIPPQKVNLRGEIGEASLLKGTLRFRVVNSGNSHILLSKVNVTGLDNNSAVTFSKDSQGWYLLAGKSRYYDVKVSRNDCMKSDRIKITIETEQHIPVQGMVAVDKNLCEEPKDEVKEKSGNIGDILPNIPGK